MAPLDSTDQGSQDPPVVHVPGANGQLPNRPKSQPSDPAQSGQTPVDPAQSGQVPNGQAQSQPQMENNLDPQYTDEALLKAFADRAIILGWFKTIDEIDKNRLAKLKDYVQIHTMAPNENGGFDLHLANSSVISWVRLRQEGYADQEFIHGQSKGFGDPEADAIIALSAVRGWEPINVHGTDAEKDLLWLAAKKQGLSVANYEPAPGSAIEKRYEDWQREQSAGPAVTPALSIPVVTPANPAGNAANGTGNSGGPAPVAPPDAGSTTTPPPAQEAQPQSKSDKPPAQQQQQKSKGKPAAKSKEPADSWWLSKEYADLFVGLADGVKSVTLDKKQIENPYIWTELTKRGIEVANYTPHKNSKVWKAWQEWQKNNPVQTVAPPRADKDKQSELFSRDEALSATFGQVAPRAKHEAEIKQTSAFPIPKGTKTGRPRHAKPD